MPSNIQTDVTLTAKTKGLDAALQKTMGVNRAGLEGMRKQAAAFQAAQKEVQKYEDRLKPIIQQQKELATQLADTKRGTDEYKKLQKALQGVKAEYRDLSQAIDSIQRANEGAAAAQRQLMKAEQDHRKQSEVEQKQIEADREKRRQAFVQGFAQAMPIPSAFVERGPGMYHQLAGQMVGGGIRRGGAAGWGLTGGALTTGLQGFQQGLAALPFGGVLAGQLGSAAGFAEQALAYERQLYQASPFVQLGGTSPGLRRARAELAAFETGDDTMEVPLSRVGGGLGRIADPNMIMTPQGRYVSRSSPLGQQLERMQTGEAEAYPGETVRVPWSERLVDETDAEYRERVQARQLSDAGMRSMLQEEVRRERAKTSRAQMTRIGTRLGMTPQEVLQEATTYAQGAGGVLRQSQGMRAFETALSAQKLFGVGIPTTGAFGQGVRRGGLVGAGTGAEAITDALRTAVELGMSGSEVTRYMEQVASGISQFQSTGIPFNQQSMASLAKEFSMGLTGTRAAAVGQGVQQYVQGIGQRGPGSGLDLLLMQTMGGYEGGGAAGLEQAFIQLEEMGTLLQEGGIQSIDAGGKMGGFMRRIMEMGGGGAGGRLFLRRILGRMGVNVGAREMSVLGKRLAGEELSPEEQTLMQQEQARREATAGQLPAVADPGALAQAARGRADRMARNLQQRAGLAVTELGVGQQVLPSVQNLAKSAALTNSAFMNLSENTLKRVTSRLVQFAEKIEAATENMDSLFGDNPSVGLGG